VRAESSFGAKSKWEGRQFTVDGPSPGTPGVADPTGSSDPGVGVIQVVPDTEQGAAAITLQDTSNMLSAQQSDAESNVEAGQFTATNASVARSTEQAYPGGSASWKVASTGAGDATAYTDWLEVAPSVEVTATGQFRAAATARSCSVGISFYDETFTLISSTFGNAVTDSTSTWRGASVVATTPAGAAYARVAYRAAATAAAEAHYIDRLSLSYGEETAWSDGGQMSRNLLSDWYSSPGGTAAAGEAWTGSAAVSVATVASTGLGASGSLCNRMTYNGMSPSIAYRAAGTAFTSPTSGANYTLNKPAGVVTGDLMIAFVTVNSATADITPPAGWAVADTVRITDTGVDNQTMFVLKRTAGGSEPASWTDGFVSANLDRRTAIVVAYSGAADASAQFLATAQAKNANNSPMFATTGSVNNTDPNAWRISAFAVSDNASGGTLTANRQQPAVVPDISYVGRATAWKYAGGDNTYFQINKPTGVQSGDVMIASLFVVGVNTITAPSGWTIEWQGTYNTSSSAQVTGCVMRRVAGSSEPSSWSGSMSGSANQGKVCQCVAYRNVDTANPFITEQGNTAGSGSSGSTSTIANTDARAWRVVAFGAGHGGSETSLTFTSSEVSERCDDRSVYSSGGFFPSYQTAAVGMWDSNGPVPVGDHQRTVYASTQYVARFGWIGLLRPRSSPPSAVADETARQVAAVGASNPYTTVRVFDSYNAVSGTGVVPTGAQTISGVWTPGSGSDMNNMIGWQGLIVPAAPQVSGYGRATMATTVDISSVDPQVIALAHGKVAVTSSFLGSKTGTPFLTVHFYRANVLLRSDVAEGSGFNDTVWTKSAAVFDLPEGTTRMAVEVSASDMEIGDIVYWDRTSLAFGESTAYRPGTSRATHPVWSRPEIEFADDSGAGYTAFRMLPGSLTNAGAFDSSTGYALFTDHTIVPLTNRKYRAKTVVYGLAGDLFVSGFGPETSEFNIEAVNWWLKDIVNPANNLQLKVRWDDFQVATTSTATVFQPIGADLPVVLSEGYKGDSFTVNLKPVNHSGWAQLKEMLLSGRTLFLQSDIDHAWFVRPVGDLSAVVLATNARRSNPLREISVSFVQVEEEL
jgi:hypothetical protein